MAALVEGHQYGLSSHDSNSDNRTLIFVKLTDSALKSIEEYVRNKSNSILKPSIQFQSNNGVIRLPNSDSHSKSYGFTLSNVETDGPQGSFECLQQNKSKSLESLGCMMLKMHINANEESYEKTRVKMAAVEKENKKMCTKEIKPSSSNVARKLKMRRAVSAIPLKTSPLPYTAHTPKVPPKSYQNSNTLCFTDSSAAASSDRHHPVVKTTKNPELLKLSCRNRIIHLLALRSYKKPELLAKLLSEGIKEKERRGISAILSQVAVSKGNAYELANHAWNEVQDTWKFYTKEEAEAVRMKKLGMTHSAQENGRSTPASSPDQSPSHQKRGTELYEASYQDQRGKKQRISHFNRVDNMLNNSDSVRSMRRDASDSVSLTDKSSCNDMSKDAHLAEPRTNTNSVIGQGNYFLNQKHVPDSNHVTPRNGGIHYSINTNSKLSPNRTSKGPPKASLLLNGSSKTDAKFQSAQDQKSLLSSECEQKKSNVIPVSDANKGYGSSNFNSSMKQEKAVPVEVDDNYRSVTACTESYVDHSQSPFSNSPGEQASNGYYCNGTAVADNAATIGDDSNDSQDSVGSDVMDIEVSPYVETPEYQREFVKITSREQRNRYKKAFEVEYAEYQVLHDRVRDISKRFYLLEDKLMQCKKGTPEYQNVKYQICQEYKKNRRNPNYLGDKEKLSFLHKKLSYIKKLVSDYDRACSKLS